jgi:hypothetical protein
MLAREALTAALAAGSELVPPVVFFDDGSLLHGRALLIRDLIEGVNGQVFLDDAPEWADRLWEALQTVDASLPTLNGCPSGFPGWKSHSWSGFLMDVLREMVGDLTHQGHNVQSARRLLGIVGELSPLLDLRPVRLCHGDLWPKNVLVRARQPEGCLALEISVLDWERSYVGDPLSQWVLFEEGRYTMFSVDRGPYRPGWHVGRGLSDDPGTIATLVYTGIIGLQTLCESVRNTVDLAAAARMVGTAVTALEECAG